MKDAMTRRIDWLRLRARIARNNGDHILRAELDETAQQFEWLARGVQSAIRNGVTWRQHLQNAIDKIERKATR